MGGSADRTKALTRLLVVHVLCVVVCAHACDTDRGQSRAIVVKAQYVQRRMVKGSREVGAGLVFMKSINHTDSTTLYHSPSRSPLQEILSVKSSLEGMCR